MHKHKCPKDSCGHIWQHSASDFNGSEEFHRGHACPKCGAEQWNKHYTEGDEETAISEIVALFCKLF